MMVEVKETTELELRGLSWNTICGLACKAICMGMTFDQLVELALLERIKEGS